MLFLPYRIDSRKAGIPLLTIIIIALCLAVYWQQHHKDSVHFNAARMYCENTLSLENKDVLKNVARSNKLQEYCYNLFEDLRDHTALASVIEQLANNARPTGLYPERSNDIAYIHNRLLKMYREYLIEVPSELTGSLSYDPATLDVVAMMTSTFSHASWSHVLGNLLFFYIFAASVEMIIGSVVFAAFILLASLGTSVAYAYMTAGVAGALPTVGLSGVVMAAVTMLAVMMPWAKIRCFFWFVIIFKVFRIPALLIACWFVLWDLVGAKTMGVGGGINYIAHLSGAIIGVSFGLYYRLFQHKKLLAADVYY